MTTCWENPQDRDDGGWWCTSFAADPRGDSRCDGRTAVHLTSSSGSIVRASAPETSDRSLTPLMTALARMLWRRWTCLQATGGRETEGGSGGSPLTPPEPPKPTPLVGGHVSHRADPPQVHRADPPQVHRADPPQVHTKQATRKPLGNGAKTITTHDSDVATISFPSLRCGTPLSWQYSYIMPRPLTHSSEIRLPGG